MINELRLILQNFFASFEKVPFTMEDISQMKAEGEFPPLILYAAPVMLGLMAVEILISQYSNRKIYENKDLLASSAIGLGYLVSVALFQAIQFGFMMYFYSLAQWTIPITWWSFVICLLVLDFCRYWAHRLGHEQRVFWASHVTHHSSEKMNFSVSFRLSWIQHYKIIFFTPIALLGFHPIVFFIANQVTILYQFWCHTELIGKLPKPIEYFFVTPSHHRVHHGTNPHYLDKNYGSTFIIWDRIFGTFQEENEKPIYGITKPVGSYNPIYLNFHELIDMVKDIRHAGNFKTKWNILWKKPGYYTAREEEEAMVKLKSAASEAPAATARTRVA